MAAVVDPIRVLVVDDSVVVRRLVTDALSQDPAIEVVGTAANGRIALSKLDQVAPDLVTLDVEMPEMDGVATLREIRRVRPRLPVIMFSTLTERGAAITLDALAAGASDYVAKPANVGRVQEAIASVRDELTPRIRALVPRGVVPAPARPPQPTRPAPVAPTPGPTVRRPRSTRAAEVVAIGASTGGPNALTEVLGSLPADLPVPVVVVQHMPPVFTRQLAERLDRTCAVSVFEGEHGAPLRPGQVWIAPGGRHMQVVRRGDHVPVLALTDGPPENSCRPAVDVLFRTTVQVFGDAVLGVVLTGMGEDGLRGARTIVDSGGHLLAQDEPTSVVWGMPGAVVRADLPDAVLPLREVAPAVVRRVMPRHEPAAAGARP